MTGPTGVGIGWRAEIDRTVEALVGAGAADFVEVVAEDVHPAAPPASLSRLRARGTTVVPHAVSLSLGGAEELRTDRVDHLAAVAVALGRAAGQRPRVLRPRRRPRVGAPPAGAADPRRPRRARREHPRRPGPPRRCRSPWKTSPPCSPGPTRRWARARSSTELCGRTGGRPRCSTSRTSTPERGQPRQDPARVLDDLPLEQVAYVHAAGGVTGPTGSTTTPTPTRCGDRCWRC